MLVFAFIPFVTGYLYSKGIKMGKFAVWLKGRLGIKNLVVGLTWSACIAGLGGKNCGSIVPTILVFIFFGAKLFVNSAIYDFKDIKGDTLAGIKTLLLSLGEKNTCNLLTGGIHLLSHLILSIALKCIDKGLSLSINSEEPLSWTENQPQFSVKNDCEHSVWIMDYSDLQRNN